VLDYLHKHLPAAPATATAHNLAGAVAAAATGGVAGGADRDALELTLALWHRDAGGDSRKEVLPPTCLAHTLALHEPYLGSYLTPISPSYASRRWPTPCWPA
jgi:hypothetical protein